MSETKDVKESDVEQELVSGEITGTVPNDKDEVPKYQCGWFSFRPKCLQRFMNPKWALFWLCWAGAVQGEF